MFLLGQIQAHQGTSSVKFDISLDEEVWETRSNQLEAPHYHPRGMGDAIYKKSHPLYVSGGLVTGSLTSLDHFDDFCSFVGRV